MTNEEIDDQIRYLTDEVIPYLLEYYKIMEISDVGQELRLNQLLDEINRLKNLKE